MSGRIQDTFARTSYEGIEFPSMDITTAWGHDSARHQGLLTAGADIQTTGRKPFAIHLRIPFVNAIQNWFDTLYPDLYEQLMQKFEAVPLGTLVHPTKGQLLVHVDDIQEHVDTKIGNGVFVDVSFTAGTLPDEVFSGQTDINGVNVIEPADATLSAAQNADSTLALIPTGIPGGVTLVTATISAMLDTLNAGTVSLLVANSAFATGIKAVSANLAIATTLGVSGHDYRAALEATLAALYTYRDQYISQKQPKYVRVPANMSLSRIAALPQVYSDASKANLLLLSNSIPDPTLVAAGTVITVLPILGS